ncbi:MFS transporter [Xanthomonas albilineans]|uniref:Putative major facilitator superfamily mfs protein n=1 Tax=Xanthomonas albilineans (strain GPE PC73 / CFBP 7063) TaxID=380358 RepID=D2UBD9_XANAP|nr:MFS transporter [Xanthomonas albilineans]QHQ27121.1 putative major facilitator superfamily mfs protein [Xanthomonas albilineans]CBA14919.1 putative major facilitator superfamily mfs protein [Xanthomonas albilineans GPE PC73]
MIGGLGTWWRSLDVYANPRVRAMLFLGFSSGLPFALVLTTLSARLRQAGIDRTTIGYFSLVGLMYSLKYFWSPIVDRLPLPVLSRMGRRRSWMLLAQVCIVAGLVALALVDPAFNTQEFALLAVLTAFAASTQDIVVDAYRIEAAQTDAQGAMAAAYQTGYQVALICAGAGALTVAAQLGWKASYLSMAACGLLGLVTTLCIAEPMANNRGPVRSVEPLVEAFQLRAQHWPAWIRAMVAWCIGAVVCPFVDFFVRMGWKAGIPALALVVAYRLNYVTMGVAANTFYLDMGFTLEQIALVSKVYGILMTIGGAFLAGLLIRRYGIARTLLIGLLLLSGANLIYAYIASIHPGIAWLAAAISADNVANGIAGTAFIAYMSSLTSPHYTATQYALFGTLWSLPAKSIASQWGRIVDVWGYPPFFIYTAAIGIVALPMVIWLIWRESRSNGDMRASTH